MLWSDEDIRILTESAKKAESSTHAVALCSDKLNKSKSAIKSKLFRLNLFKPSLDRKPWTMKELRELERLVHTALILDEDPVPYAALRLGRSQGSVRSKMLKERISTASAAHQKTESLNYQTLEIVHEHMLCPNCGRHYLVRGDLGYAHGVCEPCWLQARASALERNTSIKEMTREENRVKKKRQRERESREQA